MGGPKRRVWREIHLGIDKETLEIRAVEVTTSNVEDAPMLPELLDQIEPEQEIATVTADGAFDTLKSHNAMHLPGSACLHAREGPTTVRPQSSRHTGTPCRGSRPLPEPGPATRRSGPQHISADHCGGIGPSITTKSS